MIQTSVIALTILHMSFGPFSDQIGYLLLRSNMDNQKVIKKAKKSMSRHFWRQKNMTRIFKSDLKYNSFFFIYAKWLLFRGRQPRKNKPTWYFVNSQYQNFYQLDILSTQNVKIFINSIFCQIKKSKFNVNSISYQLEIFSR